MANNVSRYQPQNNMTRLPDLVDRLFRESFVMPSVLDRVPGGGVRPTLPVNLAETPDGYIMYAALPGLNAEELDIQVINREVTLRGTLAIDAPENGTWVWQGIPGGEFVESYNLPVEINGEKVEANYQDGILTLRLPKAEHLKPKSIKVNVTH